MVDQTSRNSGSAVFIFPEEEGIRGKITVKANFFGTPPFEIIPQEANQLASDNLVFQALPQLHRTLKNKFRTVFRLDGQHFPCAVSILTAKNEIHHFFIRQYNTLFLSHILIPMVVEPCKTNCDCSTGLISLKFRKREHIPRNNPAIPLQSYKIVPAHSEAIRSF